MSKKVRIEQYFFAMHHLSYKCKLSKLLQCDNPSQRRGPSPWWWRLGIPNDWRRRLRVDGRRKVLLFFWFLFYFDDGATLRFLHRPEEKSAISNAEEMPAIGFWRAANVRQLNRHRSWSDTFCSVWGEEWFVLNRGFPLTTKVGVPQQMTRPGHVAVVRTRS